MLPVQSKSPSLAGLFNTPESQGCTGSRQYPKHFGDSHSAKESAQCGNSEHRLNIRPMFESYIAVIPASKEVQNSDLYGEAGGDVLKFQDIKKRSTYSCIGQKADKKKGSIASATLSTTANSYQPFGSFFSLRNLSRQESLTHELKLPCPATAFISSKSESSKRMCFIVLPLRSNAFFSFSSCIGSYQYYNGNSNGNYHFYLKQYRDVKTAMPRSAPTLTGHLTTTVIKSNEEAMQENTTPAQGRHSLNLKTGNEQQSFIWIIAAVRRDCPTIKATIHHIAAPTEREARLSLVKDHVCFFAGRINQAVSHA